jgi:XRE family aerobic/anaerobic benzoate catabolism transcriptional regulator
MTKPAQELLGEVGRRVRARRHEKEWTLKQLASASGLSERFVGSLESGKANISVGNLAEVAQALELPLVTLLGGEPAKGTRSSGVISLLGLRGAGKSTIGAALAQRLSCEFLEIDKLVEREAGMRLPELFAMHGEAYFRQLEVAALTRVLDGHRRAVIATGGGIVTNPEAFELVLARTHPVWLKATPAEHWNRVLRQGDTRPMKNRPHAMAELKRRLEEREPLYSRAALTCVTTGRSVAQVVDELVRWCQR